MSALWIPCAAQTNLMFGLLTAASIFNFLTVEYNAVFGASIAGGALLILASSATMCGARCCGYRAARMVTLASGSAGGLTHLGSSIWTATLLFPWFRAIEEADATWVNVAIAIGFGVDVLSVVSSAWFVYLVWRFTPSTLLPLTSNAVVVVQATTASPSPTNNTGAPLSQKERRTLTRA